MSQGKILAALTHQRQKAPAVGIIKKLTFLLYIDSESSQQYGERHPSEAPW
jgi:hypothetical protein